MAEDGKTAKGYRRRKPEDRVDIQRIELELGKKPPQALDVEEAVLGAMFVEPSCVEDTVGELYPACFYSEKNKIIYEAICDLVKNNSPVDILTVSQKLGSKDKLHEIGGNMYLVQLSQKIGSAAHIDYYVRVLKQKAIQRQLITASYGILGQAYDDSVNVDNLIDSAQTKIFDAIQNSVKKDAEQIGGVINEVLNDLQKQQDNVGLSGVPSGFATLDKVTNGFQPSDLIILAARPSVGKTAFVLNIARNAAVDFDVPVAVFSLEMPSKQLGRRLLTSETRLSADKIKGSVKLEEYEWQQIETRVRKITQAPLYIDDTPSLSVMEFRSKVKRLVSQKGVKLVIIDYLQLMQGPPETRSMREQEVAAISRTLKSTAKEMNIPIIALSQLSRQSEMRDGSRRRPQLSDLRESGSIEQDADMVLFIHRADYQGMAASPDDIGKTTLIIAKHRNGEIRDIDLRFRHEEVRFVDESESSFNIANDMTAHTVVSGASPAFDSQYGQSADPFGPSAGGTFGPQMGDSFGPQGGMPVDDFGLSSSFE